MAKKNTASTKPQTRPAKETAAPAKAKKTTKRDKLAALLCRDEGATIDQMMKATSWLPHTVRAAMTGLRKTGYVIDGDKMDGISTYRAVAPE